MLNNIILFVQQLTLEPQVYYCIPIAIPIIAAALAVGAAGNKYFQGRKQGKLADKLGRTARPFQTPEKEFYENVDTARNMVGTGLPGQEYLRNKIAGIGSGAANKAVMAGQSPSSILSVISDSSGKQMDAEADLTYEGANYKEAALKTLMGTKTQLAGEKKESWDWNKKQPYLDAMAAASALRNASMLNKQGALEDVAKVPMLFAGGKGGAPIPGMGGNSQTATANTAASSTPSQLPQTSPMAVPDAWSSYNYATQEDREMYNNFVSSNPQKYGRIGFDEFQKMRGRK